jgi:hypothetical protein
MTWFHDFFFSNFFFCSLRRLKSQLKNYNLYQKKPQLKIPFEIKPPFQANDYHPSLQLKVREMKIWLNLFSYF